MNMFIGIFFKFRFYETYFYLSECFSIKKEVNLNVHVCAFREEKDLNSKSYYSSQIFALAGLLA